MENLPSMAFGITAAIAIVFLLMWALRELVCWYYKINQQVELLTRIYAELRKLNEK